MGALVWAEIESRCVDSMKVDVSTLKKVVVSTLLKVVVSTLKNAIWI